MNRAVYVFGLGGLALGFLGKLYDGGTLLEAGLTGLIVGFIALTFLHVSRMPVPAALREYADEYGLGLREREFRPVTPLLLEPFGRGGAFTYGEHPGGLVGQVGVFTMVRPHRFYLNTTIRILMKDLWPQPRGRTMLHATTRAEELREVLPVLLCERRYTDRLLDGVEEVARGLRSVRLESESLERRYQLFTDPRQEPSWIRRLLSPSFIEWMTREETKEVTFELFDGWVTVAKPVPNAKKLTADQIAAFSELSAVVVGRIEEELEQTQLARPPAMR